jgi:endonuclease YncB( thermonuclease family)
MRRRLFGLLLILAVLAVSVFSACEKKPGTQAPEENVDYAAKVKLNMNSDTLKQKVTVKSYVDGDTTHFNVPETVMEGGVLKARYLAVNTPESTGKIEEWGKKASKFTREKLSSASEIMIESDDSTWDIDSTGGRVLVWVWYRTGEAEEYRNLNIELLQNGLAIASNSANNRYGDTCMAAIASAKDKKLNIYSGEKDPDFFYGDAMELTLMELRTHVADYLGNKVAFEGVVTKNNNNAAYVESYDEDTGLYYGIMVYYGFGLSGEGLDALTVGNLARIVGTVQYYEQGGTYQISGLTYRAMKPDDPNNVKKLGEGYSPAYKEITAADLANGKVKISVDDTTKEFSFGELAIHTSVCIKDLKVADVHTTTAEDSSSKGAMTITCKAGDGTAVTIRTIVLTDGDKVVTADAFEGKTIDVKGLVDVYDGKYQIKVLSYQDITIK